MVVLLVSDPQAVKSLSALVVPLGRWKILRRTRGWHITLNNESDGVEKVPAG